MNSMSNCPAIFLAVFCCLMWKNTAAQDVNSGRILNCGLRGMCKNKSGIPPELCNCDDGCSVFQDCCEDRDITTPSKDNTKYKNIQISDWECHYLPGHILGIYMVTSCPASSPFSSNCSRFSNTMDEPEYILDLPTHSLVTDTWYRNYYCALCHQDASMMKMYDYTLKCSSEGVTLEKLSQEGKYVGTLTWKVTVNDNETTCILQLKDSEDIGQQRRCLPQIDSCPSDWEDQDLAEKCHSYSLLTSTRSDISKVYKNPHCAICNGELRESLMCKTTFQTRIMAGPSLITVMDIGWDVSSPSDDCKPPTGIWDVLHYKCLSLESGCEDGFHYNGSICMADNKDLTLSDTLDGCYKIFLNSGEYELKSDGTMVLNSSSFPLFASEVFSESEYKKNKNGSVSICNDVLQEKYNKLLFYTEPSQVYITTVSCTLSIICLILHFVVYWALPKLRNLPGKNLLALSLALLLAQIILLFGLQPIIDIPKGLCVTVAVTIAYFYLSAFCWMNVMSVDIWRTFSSSLNRNNSVHTFRNYSLYGWGCPGVIILVAILVDYVEILPNVARPNFAKQENVCWFGSRLGKGIFFTIPIATVLLGNIILFGATVYKIQQQTRDYKFIRKKTKEELSATLSRSSGECKYSKQPHVSKNGVSGSREQTRFYLYLKLFIIMGVTWFFGFLATIGNIHFLMYPFILLNGLQGVFIFVMFDLKRRTGRMLWERFLGNKYDVPPFLDSKISTSNTNSSVSTTLIKKLSRLRESSTSSTGVNSSNIFRPLSDAYDIKEVRHRVSLQQTIEPITEDYELMLSNDRTKLQIKSAEPKEDLAPSNYNTEDKLTRQTQDWNNKFETSDLI